MRKKNSAFITSGLIILFPVMSFAASAEKTFLPKPVYLKASDSQETPRPQATPESSEKKEPFQPFTGKISAKRVRLRTQPSLEGYVVKELTPGDLYAVVNEDSEYYAVQAPKGMKGFVFRTFVLEDVVEGARVNVRLYPDTDSPIIGQLNSGDRIKGLVSAQNNKWLEIDTPSNTRFYIAKEYIEKIGGLDFIQKHEQRKTEAAQLLNAALLYGQSELRKPFEEIDLNTISKQFEKLNEFADIREISEKSKETQSIIQETYIQKKIAFLESKADRTTVSNDNESAHRQALALEKSYQDKLSQIEAELQNKEENFSPKNLSKNLAAIVGQSVETSGNSSSTRIAQSEDVTDKMLVWEPLEQTIYQIWSASNEDKNMTDFYDDENINATVLTGIIESYVRPVKNRPGDFILRIDNLPVAFLYSTKINLQDKVGKKVTVMATPRPNNNFAFPAYYVLSIE